MHLGHSCPPGLARCPRPPPFSTSSIRVRKGFKYSLERVDICCDRLTLRTRSRKRRGVLVRETMVTGRVANRRWRARLAGVIALVATALIVTPGIASARPYNPTNGQITAAQQAASAAAAQVGVVSGQLQQAQDAVSHAEGEANIALDRYQGKEQEYQVAQSAARVADAAAQQAQAALDAARV